MRPWQKNADLLLSTRFACYQPDPGAQLFSHDSVRQPHHLHVGDLGVSVQELLDLALDGTHRAKSQRSAQEFRGPRLQKGYKISL
jgi:hypothetical protein